MISFRHIDNTIIATREARIKSHEININIDEIESEEEYILADDRMRTRRNMSKITLSFKYMYMQKGWQTPIAKSFHVIREPSNRNLMENRLLCL